MKHVRRLPFHPQAQGKIAPCQQIASQSPAGQWLAPDHEESRFAEKTTIRPATLSAKSGLWSIAKTPSATTRA